MTKTTVELIEERITSEAKPAEIAIIKAMPEIMWRGFNQLLRELVAAKVIDPKTMTDAEMTESLSQNAMIMGCFLGMLRLMVLDNQEDFERVVEGHRRMTRMLMDMCENSEIQKCGDCELPHIVRKGSDISKATPNPEEKQAASHPQANAPSNGKVH